MTNQQKVGAVIVAAGVGNHVWTIGEIVRLAEPYVFLLLLRALKEISKSRALATLKNVLSVVL